jgi:hypothetical protein
MQINSTEAAGFIGFIPAAIAALFAAVSDPRPPVRKGWALIGAIDALLTIEILASMRHRLGIVLREWLRASHLFPERRPVQAALILVILAIALLAAFALVRRMPTRTLAMAAGATAAALGIFIVETVSLHAVDGVVYAPAGPILLIGWLWLACGWLTTAAGFWSVRPRR